METLEVLALIQKLKVAAENSATQISQLINSIQPLDWTGPSREELAFEVRQLLTAIENQVQVGQTLAARVEQEVAEWKKTSDSLTGSNVSISIISGGGLDWVISPILPLTPVFTRLVIAPWVNQLPDWLHDLYRKLFPSHLSVPASDGNRNTMGTKTEFDKLTEEQATTAALLEVHEMQLTPHEDHDVYYDIPPKSQGNS